jgi:hypothetical protein
MFYVFFQIGFFKREKKDELQALKDVSIWCWNLTLFVILKKYFLRGTFLNDNIPNVFDNILYYQSLLCLRKISDLGWELSQINIILWYTIKALFCGLLVRVPGRKSRCLGSIPGATRFSEK